MVKPLTGKEAEKFMDDRCVFLDYHSIDEYVEDVTACLVYSSWHYTEERARQKCKDRMALIRNCFEKKVPADDCAADVGYSCG